MLVFIILKNLARTSKRTLTISKIIWLMPFKEVITVYNKKHNKPITTECRATDFENRWDTFLLLGVKWLQMTTSGYYF
jgi:hypothetical protein